MKGDILNNQLFKKVLLPLALLVFTLSSCELFVEETEDFLVAGTWTGSFGSKIVLTEDRYESYFGDALFLSAEIVDFENGEFNTSTELAELGEHGYLTLKYNGGAGNGKYGVLRWHSLETVDGVTTFSYSEGAKDGNPDPNVFEGIYFDSEDEAEAGMDDTFFTWFSLMTKQ